MTRAIRNSRLWRSVTLAVAALTFGCGPGTPPPPFTDLRSATPKEIKAACDSAHFDFRYSRVGEVAPGLFAFIVPESLSYNNSASAYEQGRVVAKMQLLGPGRYDLFNLETTDPACLFMHGTFGFLKKTKLYTAIFSQGRILKDSIETEVRTRPHLLHAEAHWEPAESGEKAAFDLRPSELFADDGRAARVPAALQGAPKVTAYSQTTCTNHSCCIPSGPKRAIAPVPAGPGQ